MLVLDAQEEINKVIYKRIDELRGCAEQLRNKMQEILDNIERQGLYYTPNDVVPLLLADEVEKLVGELFIIQAAIKND